MLYCSLYEFPHYALCRAWKAWAVKLEAMKRVSPDYKPYQAERQSDSGWQIMMSRLQRRGTNGAQTADSTLTSGVLSRHRFSPRLSPGPFKCLLKSATREDALCIWIPNCALARFYVSGVRLYFYDCQKNPLRFVPLSSSCAPESLVFGTPLSAIRKIKAPFSQLEEFPVWQFCPVFP